MTAAARAERCRSLDERLRSLLAEAVRALPEAAGRTALVAVGGYGRGEMSPLSDVDVVLLHTPDLPDDVCAEVAELVWYPLWDDGVSLDHAVRSTDEMRSVAAADWKAAVGMVDTRHVAGEQSLVRSVRSAVLADWRRGARRRLPQLRAAWAERLDRAGDLAYSAVPDLKDSRGGLRDAVLLRALVATWLVDAPHRPLEEHRAALLDIRDSLHVAAGRPSDRWTPELLPDVARLHGVEPEPLDHQLRDVGRRTGQLVDLTWSRLLHRSSPRRRIRTRRIDRSATDPFAFVPAAADAAERGVLLGPSAAAWFARPSATLPDPWPEHARRDLVRLLAAGPGLVPVWETLDCAGLVGRFLPEWSGIRLRRSQSAVHRFTIDRHSVETCVEASHRLRDVARPDLLVLAALLHDIGKGPAVDGADRDDHSTAGAQTADKIARRLGFDDDSATTVAFLVRNHLLLPGTAVRRDLDDPATARAVAAEVGDLDRLELLATLVECDARSAGPTAWTGWRAGQVHRLVGEVAAVLRRTGPQPTPVEHLGGWEPPRRLGATGGRDGYQLVAEAGSHGSRLLVTGPDRIGLLADLAGTLAAAGLGVRAARAATRDGVAWSQWDLDATTVDTGRLKLRLDRVLDATTDLATRLDIASPPATAARVRVLSGTSATATVLEVRAADQPALLWRVFRTLADAGADVRSAHVDTLGPQAQDVLYVTDRHGRALPQHAADRLAAALKRALSPH
ncbi:MAG: HD domain-containing protein [Nocardioidaceae bacterium]|nr:HD domain-containing protein [Nocardioidaceae bacterium]